MGDDSRPHPAGSSHEKFIDLDQRIRIQEQATAVVKAASMIAKPITASATQTICDSNSQTINLNDQGLLSVSTLPCANDSSPDDKDCTSFVNEYGGSVHVSNAALSVMGEVANIDGSKPDSIVSWSREVQGPVAMNHAMQSLQSMAGGLPVDEIMKKSFEDLRPEDQRHLERYRICESVLGRCGHTFNHVSRRTPPAGASFSSDLCHRTHSVAVTESTLIM